MASDIQQLEQDETAYLLADPKNKARLLEAIANVENNQLVEVDIEKLIATD
jgi:PHD/YefM family antitoxin component YafN of YafNO toxin-antitoxin module